MIYTFGESLLDVTFRNRQPVSAWPGGAMLNTSVSLGRLGLPVSLITEYGKDPVGEMIDGFLRENGVDTRYAVRYDGNKTTVALAFLNERNEASYSFYKEYPERRLQGVMPEFSGGDYFLFGSFFALDPGVRPALVSLLKQTSGRKTFIYYDPNFRSSHLDELPALKKNIIENISMASLVRGSDEDFRNIFGAENAEDAWAAVKDRTGALIYTASDRAVYLKTPELSLEVPVPPVETVSTVGAGDTFNAGIVSELYKRKVTPDSLSRLTREEWTEIIRTAITLAGEVCGRYENYINKKA